MHPDLAPRDKLAQLRAFAGAAVPPARLRRALTLARGDLNAAAAALLADGALPPSDTPLLVAARSQTPAAPPLPAPPPQPRRLDTNPKRAAPDAHRLSTADVRRLAWRRFYQDRYPAAVVAVGRAVSDVNAYITGLWKSVGSAKRLEYTNAIRIERQLEAEAAPAPAPARAGEAGAPRQAKPPHPAAAAEARPLPPHVSPVTPANAAAPARSPLRDRPDAPSVKRIALDDQSAALTLDPHQPVPKRARHAAPHADVDTAQTPAPSAIDVQQSTEEDAPAWPKKIGSRFCRGFLLVAGKRKLMVRDLVTLEVPRPSKGPARGRAKQPAPVRIVRFAKHGREVGRVADDVAAILAPALQSGFLHAKCKVLEAPKVCKMFSEVYLEVTLFLEKDVFEEPGEQDAIEAGVSKARSTKKGDNALVDDGVDARRINVVNLISAWKWCEPPEKRVDDFPTSRADANGDAGAVSEENAEAYYRTVAEIDKKDATSFSPPKHLACTLREYQRAGVGWMVSRENYGNLGKGQDPSAMDAMLNPLWKRRMFPDGGVFYVNPTTGGLTIDAPVANAGGTFGGILADEMGLGKTVQCIACIVHDMEQQQQILGSERNARSSTERPQSRSKASPAKHEAEDPKGALSNTDVPKAEEAERKASDVETDEDKITPVYQQDEDRERIRPSDRGKREKKPLEKETAGNPHRSRRPASRDRSTYREDSDSEQSKSDEEDKDQDWAEAHGSEAEVKTAIQSADDDDDNDDDDDDWFESPRKWRNPKRKSPAKEESAFEKLMAAAHTGKEEFGGTLIICPTSLVTQWMNELHDHVAPNFLRTRTHYGQARGNGFSISLRCADVVVTTYGILASESPGDITDDDTDRMSDGSHGGPLFQLSWRRVILDEAHTIKSRTTKWARAAFRIKAERRWCVTGTVIHNHVNDVFSLLRFLQVKPWSSWAFWNRGIVSNIESKDQGSQKMAMSLLRDIISSLTLRRKKSTKDTLGRPIVHLPKKTVEIVLLTPSIEEQDFYSSLHQRSKVQFDTFVRQGKVMNNFASVLELLLRLRQACDHPYLVFAAAPSKDSVIMKDKDKLFKKFLRAGSSSEYVNKVLKSAESGALQKSMECPVCLDAIDDAVAPKECGHPVCRACLIESLQRSKKCPVCRVVIGADSITTLPRATRFSVDLKTRWRSSAKIDALMKDLKDIQVRREKNRGRGVGKTVVFSQFTSMLDLVGMALEREKFRSLRIDGSVPQAQRANILEQFENEDEMERGTANVLLVSLRAGGVGLNLVAAAHAILLDIHWNPQVDAQAQDRVHRHGQTRDVIIKRYIVKDSVEERLLQVQDRKQDIADGALGVASDEDKKQARLSELKLLFAAQ